MTVLCATAWCVFTYAVNLRETVCPCWSPSTPELWGIGRSIHQRHLSDLATLVDVYLPLLV